MDTKDLLQLCEQITKTLPIAHYLKVKTLKVEFSATEETSSFSLTEDKITIAFNNIANAIQSMLNKNIQVDDLMLEKTIRGLVYHEVSHAILTPIWIELYSPLTLSPFKKYIYTNKKSFTYLTLNLENIMEDERIETILAHYFTSVDFVENRKNVLHFYKQASELSFEGFVFNLFRFRYSPHRQARCLKIVSNFLNKTKNIRAYDRYNNNVVDLSNCMENTLALLFVIYNEYQQMLQQQKKQQEEDSQVQDSQSGDSKSQSEQETNENENSSGNNEDSQQDTEEDTEEDFEEENDNSNGNDTEESTEETEEDQADTDAINSQIDADNNDIDIEDTIESVIQDSAIISQLINQHSGQNGKSFNNDTIFSDPLIKAQFIKIFGRKNGFGNKENQATYGYSGRFNTKKYATDFQDTCKWFKKNSFEDTGINAKKSNKKVLNIYLDQSGSYSVNDKITNKILKSLVEIEQSKDDFEFNLVKFGDSTRIAPKDQRVSLSTERTALDTDFERIYRKLNPTQKEYNVFLCDGCCCNFHHIRVMNNNKSIIITESSNECEARAYCPKALDIIIENNNYASQLLANITRAFDLLF